VAALKEPAHAFRRKPVASAESSVITPTIAGRAGQTTWHLPHLIKVDRPPLNGTRAKAATLLSDGTTLCRAMGKIISDESALFEPDLLPLSKNGDVGAMHSS
jgi:hypothetical protein